MQKFTENFDKTKNNTVAIKIATEIVEANEETVYTNNYMKVEESNMYKMFNEENNMKEDVEQMNENVEINLNETLDGFENFVEAMFSRFQLALITEIYADEDVKDEFGSIVAETYCEIDDYMFELKNISTVIYVCLQIAEASEDDYRDYLNRLKALKSKLENLKGILHFMADEMEVELNV